MLARTDFNTRRSLGAKSVFSLLAKILSKNTGMSVPEKNVITDTRPFPLAPSGKPHFAGTARSLDYIAGRRIGSNPCHNGEPLPVQ
jgi:hypothetical protein